MNDKKHKNLTRIDKSTERHLVTTIEISSVHFKIPYFIKPIMPNH